MRSSSVVGIVLVLLDSSALALLLPGVARGRPAQSDLGASSSRHALMCGRRDAVAGGLSLLGAATALVPTTAWASGGATSGKTTSIPRAKLRYYDRITAVVARFQSMEAQIAKGESKMAVASFFGQVYETQDGSMSTAFDELKTAGFLLAVAFKIDSKIPPDKIQQVKDYKALMKEMDKLKSSGKDASASYVSTKAAMGVFLEGVELPPLGNERYATA